MAVAVYSEDLTDITLSEDITNWFALGGGASGLGFGADFAMQGTNCVDKAVTASEKGQVFNFGSTITPGANEHFFVWAFLATPGLANTLANRGLAVVIGTSTTAYVAFHVEGSNTYGASGRVAKCYAVRYQTTANTGSIPYRTVTGAPGAAPQYFGATANITGAVKGGNLGVDAIRRGTGMYITAGDSGAPATISAASAANDALASRWGILTSIAGSVYELQGRFVVGQSNTYVATLAYFSDSNKTILLADTPHSQTDFTQIIVDHASTVFNMTSITVEALGTNNPGRLVFNNASTVSALTGCNFVSMGITTLRAGVTALNCSWRACQQITLNGATVTGGSVSANTGTSAILAASTVDAAKVTGVSFTSAGTGHAIEIAGSAANFTISGCKFTGYSGTSTNAAVFINIASGNVEISLTNGSDTPSIRTAGATVTFAATVVPVKVTVKNALTGAAIPFARVIVEKVSDGADVLLGVSDASGIVSTSYSYVADTPVTGVARRASPELGDGTLYKPGPISGSITASGFDVTILLTPD